jgi:hypothetical protein
MPSKLSGGLKAANLIAAYDPNGRPCGVFPRQRLNCRMAKRTLRSRESEGSRTGTAIHALGRQRSSTENLS